MRTSDSVERMRFASVSAQGWSELLAHVCLFRGAAGSGDQTSDAGLGTDCSSRGSALFGARAHDGETGIMCTEKRPGKWQVPVVATFSHLYRMPVNQPLSVRALSHAS